MIRWLSIQLDRFIDWLMPLNLDGFNDDLWADELAEWEATYDVYEPDELWASHNLPAAFESRDTPEIPPSPVLPADTQPQPSKGVGGLFNFFRRRG